MAPDGEASKGRLRHEAAGIDSIHIKGINLLLLYGNAIPRSETGLYHQGRCMVVFLYGCINSIVPGVHISTYTNNVNEPR